MDKERESESESESVGEWKNAIEIKTMWNGKQMGACVRICKQAGGYTKKEQTRVEK